MRKYFAFTSIFLMLFSCTEKNPIADSQVLMDADIAFSDFSVRNGYQKAFVEFADDSVVLLKPKQFVIAGKQNLIESYKGKSDSAQILTWKPVKAIIAESGELGYTYGFWTFISNSDTLRGSYLTIWKKDINSKWKYLADIGN